MANLERRIARHLADQFRATAIGERNQRGERVLHVSTVFHYEDLLIQTAHRKIYVLCQLRRARGLTRGGV